MHYACGVYHNAELQVSFQNREYVLREGDTQAVCVELEGTLQRSTEEILVDGEDLCYAHCVTYMTSPNRVDGFP